MKPFEIVAQIIGVFAMAFNIWSYQQKQQKHIIALQLVGSTLFGLHYFMLGAYMGGLLNAVGIVRAIVFLSIGAICCEILSIISIVVGFFRLDKNIKE